MILISAVSAFAQATAVFTGPNTITVNPNGVLYVQSVVCGPNLPSSPLPINGSYCGVVPASAAGAAASFTWMSMIRNLSDKLGFTNDQPIVAKMVPGVIFLPEGDCVVCLEPLTQPLPAVIAPFYGSGSVPSPGTNPSSNPSPTPSPTPVPIFNFDRPEEVGCMQYLGYQITLFWGDESVLNPCNPQYIVSNTSVVSIAPTCGAQNNISTSYCVDSLKTCMVTHVAEQVLAKGNYNNFDLMTLIASLPNGSNFLSDLILARQVSAASAYPDEEVWVLVEQLTPECGCF